MSDDPRPLQSAREEPVPAPSPPDARSSSVSGRLRVVGAIALIVAGLGLLGYIGLLQQSVPAQHAVSAPVAWSSREVVLTDGAVIHGRLSLSAKSSPTNRVWVGLNAGVPSFGAEGAIGPSASATGPRATLLAAGALLSGPLVRLTASDSTGFQQSCVAPCELSLPSGFNCRSGTCGMRFDVTVELVVENGSGVDSAVTIGIAGGASAQLDGRLPDGLVVNLSLEAATPPAGN